MLIYLPSRNLKHNLNFGQLAYINNEAALINQVISLIIKILAGIATYFAG